MPAPVTERRRYMPGLDGLRAIAVLGVLAYHLGFAGAKGGLLGVGVFFTLSGYLITDILIGQLRGGGIGLKAFWLARARRLLPALFLLLVVVMAWVTVLGPHQPADFRLDVVSAALYFNNWWQIAAGGSYFALFEPPGPINHLWSLSIEEQFYIVWPLALVTVSRLAPRVRSSSGPQYRMAGVTLLMAFASAGLMAALYVPGVDPSRVYYGTDTRVLELLVGAALAMVWPSRGLRVDLAAGRRLALDAAGVAGLGVVALMLLRSSEFSPFLYRGGFLLLAFATALAVAALAHPASRLGPIVGCAPMRWIGERSYGIYLWHFPIIILTTPGGMATATDKPLVIAQVAATFAVAALSWRFVENPIRHGALGRLWADARAGNWRRRASRVPRAAWPALGVATAFVAAAGAGMAGANDKVETNLTLEQRQANANVVSRTETSRGPGPGQERTSCDSVVHIGDSTSLAIVGSGGSLPASKGLSAQYGRVGATTQHFEVAGGLSVYEPFEGFVPNAERVARYWIEQGFDGCWVLATGLNDAANVVVGSNVGYEQRIETMMSLIGDRQPVLWVNVRTLNQTGPYSEATIQSWDDTLLRECAKYPNMRIYDWASDVRPEWYGTDGVHWIEQGDEARARWIADALLRASPAKRGPGAADQGCLIDLKRGADR